MNGDYSERLPQEGECRNETEGCILESASAVAQRVLEEIEALAGTTACKSVQLVRLKSGHRNRAVGSGSATDPDLNGDGKVDASNVVKLVNIIMDK